MGKIVAWDSETYQGFAILLTKPHAFVEPRTWTECIDFIATDRETACYNMDYDGQACMKYLPHAIREKIALLREASFYQDGEYYTVRYVPHKFLKVWRDERLLTTVYDMAQFYNCSLERALKKLGLPPKQEIPEKWYKNMKARLADPETRETVLAYALQDARGLQSLIDETVKAFERAGLKFERPFSNASFSQRVFNQALTRKGVTRPVDKVARKAYFGGRIECLRIGYFPEAFYYDVHSAYPSVIAGLLSPNGRWITHDDYVRDDAIYAFINATLKVPDSVVCGPVSVRLRSNRIVYPSGVFRRILTLTEYRHCEALGFIKKIHAVYQHIWLKKEVYPFAKVRSLYLQRQKNPAQSYAIKIVLNAVYGKTAQMLNERLPATVIDHKTEWVGRRPYRRRESNKRFTNFVYASEITARIRTRLIQEIPPEKVIFYATDGVMCITPISGLNVGDDLGQWSTAERVTDLVVVGSGVYQYTDSDGERVTKFRGFASRFDLIELLRKHEGRRMIPVKVLRNTSLRQAVQRPHDLNILAEVERKLDLNFDAKRSWTKRRTASDLLTNQFDSEPLIYYGTLKVRR